MIASLDVIVRRAPGWPDGSETMSSLVSELQGTDATVHMCAADEGRLPRSDLELHLLRCHYGESTGAVLNRALAACTMPNVLVLDSTDVLLRHALLRMFGAFRDASYAVCYGMVIDWSGNLTSALPLEAPRLEQRDYIAAASLWRRSALEHVGGWSEVLPSETELSWDLWKRLSRSELRAYFLPRPVVRQGFVQSRADTVIARV